jgi:hypothetical protein
MVGFFSILSLCGFVDDDDDDRDSYNGSRASALRHSVPLTSPLPGRQGGEEGEVNEGRQSGRYGERGNLDTRLIDVLRNPPPTGNLTGGGEKEPRNQSISCEARIWSLSLAD